MKKRLSKKINQEKINKVLLMVEQHGYTITDKHFLDGYFLFTLGPNCVCHFHIKELPDFIFGIWLRKDGYDLFGQYEPWVDKFKPSRNEVSKDTTLESFLAGLDLIKNNYKRFIADTYYFEDLSMTEDEESINLYIEAGWANKEWTDTDIEREYHICKLEEQKYKDDLTIANREFSQLYSKELFEKFDDVLAVTVLRTWGYRYLTVFVEPTTTDDKCEEIFNYIDTRIIDITDITYRVNLATHDTMIYTLDNVAKSAINNDNKHIKKPYSQMLHTITRKDYERNDYPIYSVRN